MKKVVKILDLLLFVIMGILSVIVVVNIIKLVNIENLIRVIVVCLICLVFLWMFFCYKKKLVIYRVLVILFSCIYGFINYNFYKIYSSLDNITTVVETKILCLVTSDSSLKSIEDMDEGNIGIIDDEKNKEFYEMGSSFIKANELDNELDDSYDDYIEIINDLLSGKIKYAFLPQNYEVIYNDSINEEEQKLNFNVLDEIEKVVSKKQEENVSVGGLTEPFSVLLIGTDVILDSYNADTLMLVTVNPKTLKATMLSIPRDTYTTIACTGGKHKINASGWNGDKCVVDTVSKYLNIKIDYYAKINFLGMVDLVNELGGIEVDVPYALCEQNSKRQFGKHIVYVDAGRQTLNGEQALALSRNRHYWEGLCPKKYTTDGDRSDITRGKNQQLVIQGIVNKLVKVRKLNKFYNILDIASKNMSTNMSNETIFSFYNVLKDIVKKLDGNSVTDIVSIDRLNFKYYFANIYLSGMELSTIVNYNESVDYVTREMKKNLGLIKNDVVKSFEFDINISDTIDEVKYNRLTTSLELLPNFVGKRLGDAINYCNSKGLKCESSDALEKIIVTQSIAGNSDISTIRNKVITFEVEKSIKDDDNVIEDEKIDGIINDELGDGNTSSDSGDLDEDINEGDSSLPGINDSTDNGTGADGDVNTAPDLENNSDEVVNGEEGLDD